MPTFFFDFNPSIFINNIQELKVRSISPASPINESMFYLLYYGLLIKIEPLVFCVKPQVALLRMQNPGSHTSSWA